MQYIYIHLIFNEVWVLVEKWGRGSGGKKKGVQFFDLDSGMAWKKELLNLTKNVGHVLLTIDL